MSTNKKTLNESTIRRFMQLANIAKPISQSFLNEIADTPAADDEENLDDLEDLAALEDAPEELAGEEELEDVEGPDEFSFAADEPATADNASALITSIVNKIADAVPELDISVEPEEGGEQLGEELPEELAEQRKDYRKLKSLPAGIEMGDPQLETHGEAAERRGFPPEPEPAPRRSPKKIREPAKVKKPKLEKPDFPTRPKVEKPKLKKPKLEKRSAEAAFSELGLEEKLLQRVAERMNSIAIHQRLAERVFENVARRLAKKS